MKIIFLPELEFQLLELRPQEEILITMAEESSSKII